MDTLEMALKLIELSKDMDFEDYKETNEKDINEIEKALYHIKTISENELNSDYWKALYNLLISICEMN